MTWLLASPGHLQPWYWLCRRHWSLSFTRDDFASLQWHHNERDDISNHQHLDCLLNRLFKRWSKKTSKLRVNGLCEGNSLVTSEFPTQRASNMEIVSIWLRHHVLAPSECWEFIANGNIFVIFWSIMALIVKTWLTFGVGKNQWLPELSIYCKC